MRRSAVELTPRGGYESEDQKRWHKRNPVQGLGENAPSRCGSPAKGKRYEGAVYLAGYAVEWALKWAVTERVETIYLDGALETHDLDILLKASGLDPYMAEDGKIRPLFSALTDGWGPQGRYSGKRFTANEASLLYNQARLLYAWIIEKSL